jgi:octaprenyl-diphosphate synthase
VEERLGDYGRSVGLAFQIVDDVLDLTASEEVLGKPTASDLREGKATLAVVHALQNGIAEERADILAVIEDQSFERVSHERILAILRRNGSLEYALQAAYEHAEAARQSLTILPESEYKRALLWVPDFVVAREK